MSDRPTFSYIVLTEGDCRHHVVVYSQADTSALRILATFSNKDRADSYAEIENMMAEDDDTHPAADVTAPIQINDDGGNISEAIEIIRIRATRGRHNDRTPQPLQLDKPATPAEREDHTATLADEVLELLPSMIEDYPLGPTAKIVSQRVGADEYYVRRALRELDSAGRAVLMRRKDSPSHHLVPLGYEPPIESLTTTQENVLRVMTEAAGPDRLVRLSKRDIAERAGCSMGTIQSVLDALRGKRRLNEVRTGIGTIPTMYRIERTPKMVIAQ